MSILKDSKSKTQSFNLLNIFSNTSKLKITNNWKSYKQSKPKNSNINQMMCLFPLVMFIGLQQKKVCAEGKNDADVAKNSINQYKPNVYLLLAFGIAFGGWWAVSKIFKKNQPQPPLLDPVNPAKPNYSVEPVDVDQQNYNILLIGKSGAGKTTLINLMVNMALSLEYQDERKIAIAQPITLLDSNGKEHKQKLKCNMKEFLKYHQQSGDQDQSQTRDLRFFQIDCQTHFLTLIDTPGLGDTEGIQKDKRNVKEIIFQVQKAEDIHGICYVHKASDSREDMHLKYYIQECKGMLTKECRNNFIIVFTFATNRMKIDAKRVLQKYGLLDKNNWFYFENDCLRNYQKFKVFRTYDTDVQNEIISTAKSYWRSNKQQFSKMIVRLQQHPPKPTVGLLDLYIKKSAMMNIINRYSGNIREIAQDKIHLNQQLEEFKLNEENLQQINPADLTLNIPEKQLQQKTIKQSISEFRDISPKFATYCLNCMSSCHQPCQLEKKLEKGNPEITDCYAFHQGDDKKKNDNCLICKHHYAEHGHFEKIEYQQEIPIEVEEEVIVYQKVANQSLEEKQKLLQNSSKGFKDSIKQMEIQINDQENKIKSCHQCLAVLYHQIEKMSMSKPYNGITVDYLKTLLDQTKQNKALPQSEVQRLTDMITKQIDECQQIQKSVEILARQKGVDQVLSANEIKNQNLMIEEEEGKLRLLYDKYKNE